MVKTEDDNFGKVGSRETITSVINDHFKNTENLAMLELLGAGVGAEFYSKNINNLSYMFLLESDKSKYLDFIKTKYNNLKKENNILYTLLNKDLADFLHFNEDSEPLFEIINLDFCAPFYQRENITSRLSTVDLIKNTFRSNLLKDNGLFLTTFQITGRACNIIKETIRDKNAISESIINIAKENGYIIEEELSYVYKSSKPTTMLNLIHSCRKETNE